MFPLVYPHVELSPFRLKGLFSKLLSHLGDGEAFKQLLIAVELLFLAGQVVCDLLDVDD